MREEPDPATGRLLRRLQEWGRRNVRAADGMTADEARAMMRALLARFGLAPSGRCACVDREDPVPMRIYRPPEKGTSTSCVVFFHGGGWALGDVESYHPLVDRLAAASGAVFVSVDYRLAPEHPFPAALEDCLAVTRWALTGAAALGVAPERIFVMGDSAGGALAAAVARILSREWPDALAGQILLYPLLDIAGPHRAHPSRLRFGSGDYFLSLTDIDRAASWYAPDPASRHNPLVSPFLEPDLTGMPATRILTAGFDPLHDEGEHYARRLADAGVAVSRHCAPTTIHAFLSFRGLAAGARWRRRIAQWVRGVQG